MKVARRFNVKQLVWDIVSQSFQLKVFYVDDVDWEIQLTNVKTNTTKTFTIPVQIRPNLISFGMEVSQEEYQYVMSHVEAYCQDWDQDDDN